MHSKHNSPEEDPEILLLLFFLRFILRLTCMSISVSSVYNCTMWVPEPTSSEGGVGGESDPWNCSYKQL